MCTAAPRAARRASPGAAQASRDGRAAFATLQSGTAAQDVPRSSGQRVPDDVNAVGAPDPVMAVTGQVAEASSRHKGKEHPG